MDRRKELKELAKEIKIEAGVYQVRNTKNGKILIEATPDLKTINGRRFGMERGSYPNKALEQELQELGAAAFAIEVLEILKEPETGYFDRKDELKKLKKRWLERLQPFGEKG